MFAAPLVGARLILPGRGGGLAGGTELAIFAGPLPYREHPEGEERGGWFSRCLCFKCEN